MLLLSSMFTIIGGDGKEYGPATVEQIRAWISSGRANFETKAKSVGSDEWRRLGDFSEFSDGAGAPPVVGASVQETVAVGVSVQTAPGPNRADRISRLGAWFLDQVLSFLCTLPGFIVLGFSVFAALIQGQTDLSTMDVSRLVLAAVLLGIGGLSLLIVQVWLLSTRGQTVGKKLMGIRIVKLADGSNPGFVSAVLLRSLVPGIISTVLNAVIPFLFLGWIFFLADACFIFREDRRCIHDHIAGTIVVKA